MIRINVQIFIYLIFGFLLPAWADEDISLTKFRLSPVVAIQDNGVSYSTFISWNPEYFLNDKIKLGFNFGISAFETKNRLDYAVIEHQATATFKLNSIFEAEFGIGQQYWFVNGGTAAMCYSSSLIYFFEKNSYMIDKYYLGLSYLELKRQITREVKVGAGFSF